MTRKPEIVLLAKFVLIALFCACASAASFAQTSVEIEVAGPWSYVEDPSDSNRIVLIAPSLGHSMAVFTGENAFDYSNSTNPPLGQHRLDFLAAPCGTSSPSKQFLYPQNGVTRQTIATALVSATAYSISLPKPCFYESHLESRMRYNAIDPVTQNDAERSFTTWMILHYQVGNPADGADLDKATGVPAKIAFGSNTAASSKKAISIILFVDQKIDPDKQCDSHSAVIFDSILALWNVPHVNRAFPKLKEVAASNQQLPSYDFTCKQVQVDSSQLFTLHNHANSTPKPKTSYRRKQDSKAPGRADCHAPQVNINGVVN